MKWVIRLFIYILAIAGVVHICRPSWVWSDTSSGTPSAIYLPYVVNQKPLTPSPTLTPTPRPTSTPTSTLTPTHTQTPTVTPSPTVTSIPSGVYILENHSHYVDSINYLHVVGEIFNNTQNHLRFVKVTANFFNSSGGLVDTDFTYTFLDNLPANNKTCFHILLEQPSDWSYYQLNVADYWTDGDPLPNLFIFNDSGSYKPTFGWYEIIGQVRNDHGTRVEYVSLVGTLYSATGTVLGCDFTYVDTTHLEPGQIGSFKMTVSGRNYADVRSYHLQADGNPQ